MTPNSKKSNHKVPLRAKLMFNQGAGSAEQSPHQLVEIVDELQKQGILPEVTLGHSLAVAKDIVQRAVKDGTKLVIVAGGDGTVSQMAAASVDAPVTMGIIPTGTHNNLALNLGIPNSIPDAIGLLRTGARIKMDAGSYTLGSKRHWFAEMLTLGLWSELSSAAGFQQHGDIGKMGELLSAFVAATPFKFRMVLDGNVVKEKEAYILLINNVPYIGPNLKVDSKISFNDGYLDVFVYSDMSKLDLVTYALRSLNTTPDNGAIPYYRVKELKISVTPKTNVMADGLNIGEGKTLNVKIHPRSVTVLAGSTRGKGPRRAEVAELTQPT